ncbi:MAG: dienelactone hydrolase family protein [Bacteroidetes bacterium]|nr:dienelactone hydrolase family protein [Bacteroidota bacterium]
MKKLAILLMTVWFSSNIFAQSCCVKKEGFQMLALNADFKAAHLSPEPLDYKPKTGAMIKFHTLDAGKDGQAFYVPSDEPTNKVLIICHEWWGLNDYMKREAERWQQKLGNVDVYAVDLFDGQVAATPDVAGKLANGLDNKRAETILKGLISKIGMNNTIATLGWCMGGSWSFQATLLANEQAAGCVMYYGFPEKESKKIKQLRADVLYIWASQDKFITKDVVDEFASAVKATGHKFGFHSFDAVHAFANPSNPKHDKLLAAEAEDLSIKFLKEKLQLD